MGLPSVYNSIVVALLLTPAWFNSLARANYSDFCPAQNPEIQVESTTYTITCGKSFINPFPTLVQTTQPNPSAEDCARVCTADPECRGIVWNSGSCWKSTNENAGTVNAAGAIMLVPGETQEPDPEPVPDCQEQVNAAVGTAVAAANTNCANQVNQVQTQLNNCNTNDGNCYTGQAFYLTGAGVRFRVWCNRYVAQITSDMFHLGNTVGHRGCLDLCARNSRCMTAYYNTDTGTCHAVPALRAPTNRQAFITTFMRA